MQKGEEKVSKNLKYLQEANQFTSRSRLRWALCFLSAFHLVVLTFLKAHGLASQCTHLELHMENKTQDT